MDITTLENPQNTESRVKEEGRANFERCTVLRRRSRRSSMDRCFLMLKFPIVRVGRTGSPGSGFQDFSSRL